MGEPITSPDAEYGNDCNACTPALWPVGKTPASVWLLFDGLTSCGRSPFHPPNGLLLKLDQVPGTPCWYRHRGTGWDADFYASRPGPGDSYVQLVDANGWFWFVGTGAHCPAEHTSFVNDQFMCLFMWAAYGGSATVLWNTTVLALVKYFGLKPGSSLFLELFDAPSSDIVYKYCDRYQRTNIKFLFDH